MQISQGKKAILFIIFILILDQFIKIWIKTHMVLGQEIHFLGKYGMLHFIENNGMAFGMEWGGKPGKLILSIFRLIAIFAISWYLCQIIRKKASLGLTLAISAILAGAIGNIIDSAFYGMIFNESTYSTTAVLFPDSGGYSSFLHGKVVDMFYFPILQGRYPDWFPWLGGQEFIFFRPLFNVADSAISIGIFAILFFQRRYFSAEAPVPDKDQADQETSEKPQDNAVSEDPETLIKEPDIQASDNPENPDTSGEHPQKQES